MVDTVRTLSALQTLLADNTSGDISPQDVRDLLVSSYDGYPALTGADDDAWTTAGDPSTFGYTAVTPTGTSTFTSGNRLLSISVAGESANDLNARMKAVTLSTGDSIETAIRVWAVQSNYAMFGLTMSDGTSTTSNIASAMWQVHGSGELVLMREGTFTAMSDETSIAATFIQSKTGWVHLKLTYVSSNTFRLETSPDGVSWISNMADVTTTLTPTHVGVGVSAWGSGNPSVFTSRYLKVNT